MDENNVPGITERFMYDVEAYLGSKLPDIPEHEAQEISAYIATRFAVSLNDILQERDKEWGKALKDERKQLSKAYERELKRIEGKKKQIGGRK